MKREADAVSMFRFRERSTLNLLCDQLRKRVDFHWLGFGIVQRPDGCPAVFIPECDKNPVDRYRLVRPGNLSFHPTFVPSRPIAAALST